MTNAKLFAALTLIGLLLQSPAAARIAAAQAKRSVPDVLSLSWTSPNPVDVLLDDPPRQSRRSAINCPRPPPRAANG